MPLVPRAFYDREPQVVARELLGLLLVRCSREGKCVGRIVETEAYLASGDSSCHSHRGMSRKNATMFGRPGLLYVYPIQSRYCLNMVTQPKGVASAVLIRAAEPLEGFELMRTRRRRDSLRDLTRGPARLCEAFGVDRTLDGWDLTRGEEIWVERDRLPLPFTIATSSRIGVTSAKDLQLRFFHVGNHFVSGKRYGIRSIRTGT